VSAQGTHHAAVYAFLVKYFGTDQDPRLEDPMHTCTTKARFALVTIDGEQYAIGDIRLRMLKPRELFNAQGFPASYEIDRGADGAPITQEAQIRMCGNSVCPPLAQALVAANYAEQAVIEHRRAA
jgi:DNA (cytosine-5)-methyltransferase 1